MKTRGSCHNRHGWTLVELAVTLAIAAVAATLAVPSFDGMADRMALRSASTTLVQEMRTARQQAMVEGRPCTVVFDAARLPARVRFGAGAGVLGPPSQPTQSPPDDGVTFRQGRLTYLPDGTLSPGPGSVYLTGRLTGRGGRSSTIAITVNIAGHHRRYQWETGVGETDGGEEGRWRPL
jgi:prepilin-type N-terminal cleavage/methylation domain-containing protein